MNIVIASLICIALLVIALPHFAWAVGSTWPIRNKNQMLLAQTVIGRSAVTTMPSRWRSLGVGLIALAGAFCVLAVADHDGGGLMLTLIGLVFAAIFLFRGVMGYTARWQSLTPVEPFRTNDQRVYSPLCLLIGLGFLALVVMRLL